MGADWVLETVGSNSQEMQSGEATPENVLKLPNAKQKAPSHVRERAISLSHLSDSNQRPADYKSAALPAELKWHSRWIGCG
ncbi:MAG: hypothetical protein RL156_1567 [Bacteroidota bacterium]